MEFELTEEQQQMKMSVREFAEAEIAPHVMEWDETQHFPTELQPKLAELGLLGILFPEEYGGAGLGYIEYATVIEELSRIDGSVGISVAAHTSLCSNHIYQFGNDQQKQKFAELTAVKRWGQPVDMVGPALLLASEAGAFITGNVIVADGGMLCRTFE